MIKYIELKTGYAHNGPAWIASVEFSKSGKTIYFDGKALKWSGGSRIYGNYFDLKTREEYWTSNVKKGGGDRHKFGSGKVKIESAILGDYLKIIGASEGDLSGYDTFDPVKSGSREDLHAWENRKL